MVECLRLETLGLHSLRLTFIKLYQQKISRNIFVIELIIIQENHVA